MTASGPGPATIQIAGNSGCSVTLLRDGSAVVLEKSATDPRYSQRLRLQIGKQRAFAAGNTLPRVRIPAILSEADSGGLYSARMDYVYFRNSVDFFASSSLPAIDSVISMVLDFVDRELSQSSLRGTPVGIFQDKVDSVEAALVAAGMREVYAPCLAAIREALARRHELVLPVGTCHGDLTFSNIMIASDATAIGLIDFLDSFVDSPLLDIAKLRQDSRFCWTRRFVADGADKVRFAQVMAYIDRRIDGHYRPQGWYRDNIELILFLTMLRIAPYAKDPDTHQFLLATMRSMRFQDD
jgi:hypothetical protein